MMSGRVVRRYRLYRNSRIDLYWWQNWRVHVQRIWSQPFASPMPPIHPGVTLLGMAPMGEIEAVRLRYWRLRLGWLEVHVRPRASRA